MATALLFGMAITALDSFHSRWAAVAMVVGVVIAALILIWLCGLVEGMLALLIVTCLIDRYTFSVGPVNIRPEQVAALIALVVTAAVRIRGGRLT